jgi:hypothetical protein
MIKKLISNYQTWRYKRIIKRQQFSSKSVAEIFTETFRNRYWRSKESVSGQGSELGHTALVRTALPGLLHDYGVRLLLDLPCGDFNWMQAVDLGEIRYIGGDIVADLVLQNHQKYGNANRSFLQIDLLCDPLPAADCILLRDCLVHFSLTHIAQALDNLKKSDIKYILTTTFPHIEHNEDIQTGYWRPINLEKAPFFFPKPLFLLQEAVGGAQGSYADKSLGLWEIDSLKA